jgi:hypothetical protein
MRSVNLRLKSSTGCQREKHGPRTILLKLLTILLSGSPFRWWTRQQQTAGLIRRQSQLRRLTLHARPLFRAISAKIAALAGINQFQMFATVNTKKTSVLETAISPNRKARTASRGGRAPGYITFFRNGSGWCVRYDKNAKRQATSVKHQAPIFRKQQASSVKLSNQPVQAPSDKHPIQNNKRQALSRK